MKRFLLMTLALIVSSPLVFADGKSKGKKVKTPAAQQAAAAKANNSEVRWMTIGEAEAAMKKQPRKVWIDFYTSWCGWCKVMDKKTYSNPNVIQYLNEHFYCVKQDAESKETIAFNGKTYSFVPNGPGGTNQIANELLQGQLTYPSSVFMQENFKDAMPPIAGYLDVPTIEVILTYLAKDKFKSMSFEQYKNEYRTSWETPAGN